MKTPLFLLLLACPLLPLTSALAGLKWDRLELTVPARPEDGKIVAQFGYVNSGPQPVTIREVRTSCGCTAAMPVPKTCPPGGRGAITVQFTIGSRRGYYETPITVVSDDPDQPRVTLEFRPLIRELLEIKPTFLYWQQNAPRDARPIQVTVTGPEPVAGLRVAASKPGIRTWVEPVKPGREFRVMVQPDPDLQSKSAVLTIRPAEDAPRTKEFRVHLRFF